MRTTAVIMMTMLALWGVSPAWGQTAAPTLLSYQGQLLGAGGAPITSPTLARFTILWGGTATENPSTGKPVYQEDVTLSPDGGGVFHHLIGAGTPTSGCDENRDGVATELCVLASNDFPDAGTVVYLELRIDPAGVNNLLTPRQQVASVAYAFSADKLDGVDAAALEESAEIDTKIGVHAGAADPHPVYVRKAGSTMTGQLTLSPTAGRALIATAGNVGIGATTPVEKLEVVGNVKATGFIGGGSGLTGILPASILGDAGMEFGGFFNLNNIPLTITSLGSITIDAPGPGFVILTLSGDSLLQKMIHLNVGIGRNQSTSFSTSRSLGVLDDVGNPTSFFPFSVVWVVPIAAASTETYFALVQKGDVTSIGNQASVSDVNLVGVFIPKRY